MSGTVEVRFVRLRPRRDADIPLPRYMSDQAAGLDLCAAVEAPLTLVPGGIARIPTGFAMALPAGFEAQIRPRSGLAVRHGVTLINAPGTIDSDYRGEVLVALVNLGPAAYTVGRGDRVAQMIVQPVWPVRARLVAALEDTARSDGGFGHTGV